MILRDIGSIVTSSKIAEGRTHTLRQMVSITDNAIPDFIERLNNDKEETSTPETSKKGSSL